MFTSPTSPLQRTPAAGGEGPTLAQIRAVQAVAGRPCLSLLMATTPGAQMSAADAGRLRALLLQAQRRLEGEGEPGQGAEALQNLAALAIHAAQAPTFAGLALYASASYAALIPLPLKVVDRVVVDPFFATRDLVRCLHRAPRHVVLALSAESANLFTVIGGQLAPARASFPIARQAPGRGLAARPASRDRSARAYLHAVDRALGAFLATAPAPLVLIGPAALTSAFRARSRNLARLAGVIEQEPDQASARELLALVRPVADEHLHSRQREALEIIDARAGTDLVATGITAAWKAAHQGHPEVLVVEDTLTYPARASGHDGEIITPAADVEHRDVIDDAVDELIETVMARGGWVALVEEGTLAAHGGVALALEGPR